MNLPAGALVALLLVFIHIPERPASADKVSLRDLPWRLDLFGFVLFAPAAVMFLMALEFGGTKYAWNSATVIGLFVGSAANSVLFLLWEKKQGDEAMIPLGMVAKRVVWTSMLASMFLMGGVLLTGSYYLPIYFQAIRGVSPFLSGVYVLPAILSNTILAVISGVLGQSHAVAASRSPLFQVLTLGRSGKARLLPPLERVRRCPVGCRKWPALDAHTSDHHRPMGRVPNHRWRRSRIRHTNGENPILPPATSRRALRRCR